MGLKAVVLSFITFLLPRKWLFSYFVFFGPEKSHFDIPGISVVLKRAVFSLPAFHWAWNLVVSSLHTFLWPWIGPSTHFQLSCVPENDNFISYESTFYIVSGWARSPVLSSGSHSDSSLHETCLCNLNMSSSILQSWSWMVQLWCPQSSVHGVSPDYRYLNILLLLSLFVIMYLFQFDCSSLITHHCPNSVSTWPNNETYQLHVLLAGSIQY